MLAMCCAPRSATVRSSAEPQMRHAEISVQTPSCAVAPLPDGALRLTGDRISTCLVGGSSARKVFELPLETGTDCAARPLALVEAARTVFGEVFLQLNRQRVAFACV